MGFVARPREITFAITVPKPNSDSNAYGYLNLPAESASFLDLISTVVALCLVLRCDYIFET